MWFLVKNSGSERKTLSWGLKADDVSNFLPEFDFLRYALCAMPYANKPATRSPPAILPVAAMQHMHDLY